MLRSLSGRSHQVMTGVTVLRGKQCITRTEVTDVYFRDLTDAEIHAYVASGEPMDKAGAYGIQGGAARFCRKICGDYYNVMGLPVCAVGIYLQALAPELFDGCGA
jgi:septum formation protein